MLHVRSHVQLKGFSCHRWKMAIRFVSPQEDGVHAKLYKCAQEFMQWGKALLCTRDLCVGSTMPFCRQTILLPNLNILHCNHRVLTHPHNPCASLGSTITSCQQTILLANLIIHPCTLRSYYC